LPGKPGNDGDILSKRETLQKQTRFRPREPAPNLLENAAFSPARVAEQGKNARP
jgi:hypothetical protein